jgi:hypothetical protein
VDIKVLQEQLESKRKATAAKIAEKNAALEAPRLQREIEFEDAKLKALEAYLPEQLFDAQVEGVGPCGFHWPDEITYNHFMKSTGAIRGDLSKMTIEHAEDLVSRCNYFPGPAKILPELRARNPHARTVIATKLLEQMREKIEAEGK